MDAGDRLFRDFPDPVWICARDTGRVLDVNDAALRFVGLMREAVLALSAADLKARFALNQDLRHEVTESPTRCDGIAALLCVARPAAAGPAGDAASLAAMAGRVARFGGWSVEVATDTVTWSDEAAAIHEEPAGTQPKVEEGLDYFVPEHRPMVEAAFRQCVRAGEPFDLTVQITTRTGRRLWVRTAGEAARDPAGQIIEVRGAFQDIDELIKAQEALRLSENRLSAILNRIDEGFLILTPQFRIVFLNTAGRALLNLADDFVGRNLWDVFPEARGSIFQQQYEAALATGKLKPGPIASAAS